MNAKTQAGNRPLKVISWNLLRRTGAGAKDVAALIARHKPDLLLLQEATEDLCALPDLVGGHFFREPLDGRIYGLAVWSPHPLPEPYALRLPVSQVPGRVPPRVAQIVQFGEVAFANVHLSHGQFLNRWQLLHIATALDGPAAIVGDYNAVGPVKLGGFKDIGPRQSTHSPSTIISFRLDRCMARGLRCRESRVLARGPSDHHPIVLELQPVPSAAYASGRHVRGAKLRPKLLRANMERWLRTVSERPNRIRVGQNLLEVLDLKLRNNRMRKGRFGRMRWRQAMRAENDNLPRHFDDRAGADMR